MTAAQGSPGLNGGHDAPSPPTRRLPAVSSKRVAVIGSGYVGTTVAGCLSFLGHRVVAVEIDHHKLRSLRTGRAPFHEHGIDQLLRDGLAGRTLRFTDNVLDAVRNSDVVFLAVGTPLGTDGRPDMRALDAAARTIGAVISRQIVVNKSTIPIGGAHWLASIIQESRPEAERHEPLALVANPEFLREGSAVQDFLSPHRVVLGSNSEAALDTLAELYSPILRQDFPGGDPDRVPILIRTSPETAELVKFASNAFLATKVSFMNEIANICERVGADVTAVSTAMGLDPRIGSQFLGAGIGWGGSCLGKDLTELIATAEQADYDPALLRATLSVNTRQRGLVVRKLQTRLRVLQGRRICLLGLAFKPGTDDIRDAPGVDIARQLMSKGAVVTAYDPAVSSVPHLPDLGLACDPYEAADQADATVLTTEWRQFIDLDFARLRRRVRGPLFIDGRNCLDAMRLTEAGFHYERIGGCPGATTTKVTSGSMLSDQGLPSTETTRSSARALLSARPWVPSRAAPGRA
jgi:UDPglucose 6-dehydrogenase